MRDVPKIGRLERKVAFVTGAGAGIGRAAAERFASEGARVVAADIVAEAAAETASTIAAAGGDSFSVHADLTQEHSVAEAFRRLDEQYGRIDILYNCAGGSTTRDKPVDELEVAVFHETIARDLLTMVLCSREGVRRMKVSGGGAIVNMASFLAFKGGGSGHAYVAAKGGIVALTRAMAASYADDGIRTNAVAPGAALSERAKARIADPEAVRSFDYARYPFAFGTPAEIANVALFLVSDEARMVNGQTILADGGLSIY